MRANLFKTFATALTTLLIAATAQAHVYTFHFNAADHAHNITGTITTADAINAIGGYDILAVTGTVSGIGGGAITSLIANPRQPDVSWNDNRMGFYYNNVMHTTGAALDYYGMLFTAGGNAWNLFSNSNSDYELYSWTASANHGVVDVHGAYAQVMEAATPVVPMDDMPSNVPEPSTFALLSLAAIGLIRSRRHA